MSRLLRSLRNREEAVGRTTPSKVLERWTPPRLVVPIASVIDREREILQGGCSLLGFLKGPLEPHFGEQHLLAYTRALEEQQFGPTIATYRLQVWKLAGGAGGEGRRGPLEKVTDVGLFSGATVAEDEVRHLLTFVETHSADYLIAHAYPVPFVAAPSPTAPAPVVRRDQGEEAGRLCFCSIIQSPLALAEGSRRGEAPHTSGGNQQGHHRRQQASLHFSYSLCAPYPLFEPQQCVLPGNLLLFNTAESINTPSFGGVFGDGDPPPRPTGEQVGFEVVFIGLLTSNGFPSSSC